MDIGLCLFLADGPFRLGHLEISFGICSRLGGVEVNIRLRLADFDPCFAAQTIDAQADFAADFVGVASPDIEPVVEMEI